MQLFILCLVIVIIILLMIPNWNHICKLNYMTEHGYSTTYKPIGYDGRVDIIFEKDDIVVSEETLKKLTLDEIKEIY